MLKLGDTSLQVRHAAPVPLVDCARDETDVARRVGAVNVSPVHVQARVIPPRKRDHVFEKEPLVHAPLGRDEDAAGAVIPVPGVAGVVAPADGSAEATHEPAALGVVGNDVRVGEVLFDGRPALALRATSAASRATLSKVCEKNDVRAGAAGTADQNSVPAESAFDGKFAEPVARARERVFAFEASRLAAFQESPQWTR